MVEGYPVSAGTGSRHRPGTTAVTGIRIWLLPAVILAFSACGKKGDTGDGSKVARDSTVTYAAMGRDQDSGISAAKAASSDAHTVADAFDGFYIHRAYLDSLKASLSIFKTRFPNGTVYLQIQGDSVIMDYSNHEGGSGRLRVDSGTGPLLRPEAGQMGGGNIVLRPQPGASVLAWESGTDSAVEFIELPRSIRTIGQLYGRLLLDGVYRCVGEGRCADTATLAGDSLTGLKGGTRRLRVAIDWLDNMPQMDFMVLTGPDTVQWAYAVSRDKLEFFAIDLPKACKSLGDYDCPLTDAKPGKKLLELNRIGGAPAGSASRL